MYILYVYLLYMSQLAFLMFYFFASINIHIFFERDKFISINQFSSSKSDGSNQHWVVEDPETINAHL